MLFKQLIEAFDIIDSKNVNGNSVASYLKSIKQDADIQVYPLVGPKGSTAVSYTHLTLPTILRV